MTRKWIVFAGCLVAATGASLGYVAEHSVLTAGFAIALWVCVGVLLFRARPQHGARRESDH